MKYLTWHNKFHRWHYNYNYYKRNGYSIFFLSPTFNFSGTRRSLTNEIDILTFRVTWKLLHLWSVIKIFKFFNDDSFFSRVESQHQLKQQTNRRFINKDVVKDQWVSFVDGEDLIRTIWCLSSSELSNQR